MSRMPGRNSYSGYAKRPPNQFGSSISCKIDSVISCVRAFFFSLPEPAETSPTTSHALTSNRRDRRRTRLMRPWEIREGAGLLFRSQRRARAVVMTTIWRCLSSFSIVFFVAFSGSAGKRKKPCFQGICGDSKSLLSPARLPFRHFGLHVNRFWRVVCTFERY
jgi:hypothetical protein